MPELPEIALYQKYIEETYLHKRITHIDFHHTGSLRAPQQDFEKFLIGKAFTRAARLGKYLYLETSGKKDLVMHFGMSGKPEFFKKDALPKYSRVVFSFEREEHLAYVCRRKLGKLFLTESLSDFREEQDLGEDALDLDQKKFLDLLDSSRAGIKSLLMDQHLLAGIGNVYADEMLFQAKIHPATAVPDIGASRRKILYKKVREVLEKAIAMDGDRSGLQEDWITPHRKAGADCPRCTGKIQMEKIAGRSTYFCPSCQKKGAS